MSSPYGYETWGEKFGRKFKENPWVPAGCLATTGALIMSAVKMRSGKSQQMNYWMRARVGLQGLTLVALVAGSMALKAERDKEKSIEEVKALEVDQEFLKQKEKDEFEERLRGAEAAHLQESALAAKTVVKGPSVVKRENQPLDHPGTSSPELASPTGTKKSWWKVW
ncbi:hypothetical protein EST38_g2645 [Candolleomyces aberdarensis]|uniref:HIG1 domain-containing protein n=1 Tax=Candolleomyces aberdarensis TaxID=2316362 RepID=A0A4Q2DT18_9AGAR|nr:hypothetical protein EST38_g2645 [Candolleomyces aberdarensis]